jgi:integrase
MSRRRFGTIRQLPSRRWQASYLDNQSQRHQAPHTFTKKTDADRWLARMEFAAEQGGQSLDQLSVTRFGDYARVWLDQNPRVGPRWRETCRRNLRLHLASLDDVPLRDITPLLVRTWHATALQGTGGRTSIAQSYRFLRAVLNTAVRDEILTRNPCNLPGAGTPRAQRRPVATPKQVTALVNAMPPIYRAAVILAAWAGLRRGEILALHRQDVDLDGGTVTVRRTQTELLATRAQFDSPPKTEAGFRTVTLPPHVISTLRDHLAAYAGEQRVFVSATGAPMRGDALYQAFARARSTVGMEQFRFHDLRHTGQTLAASTGATLADLMKRLGHASPAAAMRYLHTVNGRDEAIAQALSVIAEHGDPAQLPKSVTTR